MVLAVSQNLRDYTKTVYALDSVVHQLKDDDWDKQTPNDEWNARETLGHVIWGMRRIAAAINDAPGPAEQAEAEVAGANPVGSWEEARDHILAALDSRGALQKIIQTPFGEMPADDAIGSLFLDPLTHAWDIARAAGIDAYIPEELAAKALQILEAVGDAIRGPGFMGEAIEVSDSATMADRLAAYTGRTP